MGAPLTISRRTLTVEQFHKMADAGVFQGTDRIELIEGEMFEMAPIGHAHAYRVNQVGSLLGRAVGDQAIVWNQNPIALPPNNELQPDLVLLEPKREKFKNQLPTASDVLLIVEVADTSLTYDRDVKTPIYAANQIREVWVMDIRQELLLVFRNPIGNAYAQLLTLRKQDSISPEMLPTVAIRVSDLWQ